MLLQLIWVVLEERTDWENTPLDNIIDEVEAFDGIERDSLLHALWYFMDAMLTNFALYEVPMPEVRRRLCNVLVLDNAVLLEFVTPRPAKKFVTPLYSVRPSQAYLDWIDQATC